MSKGKFFFFAKIIKLINKNKMKSKLILNNSLITKLIIDQNLKINSLPLEIYIYITKIRIKNFEKKYFKKEIINLFKIKSLKLKINEKIRCTINKTSNAL